MALLTPKEPTLPTAVKLHKTRLGGGGLTGLVSNFCNNFVFEGLVTRLEKDRDQTDQNRKTD